MATSHLLARAIEHHQAGRLAEAELIYRQILRAEPSCAEAHNNLGLALHARGDLMEAMACFEQALQCMPRLVEAHNNLGNALKNVGRSQEALASYHRALELKPDFGDALYNLASTLHDQGQLAEAVRGYRQVLQVLPRPEPASENRPAAAGALRHTLAAIHARLGDALKGQGQYSEAIVCYEQALQLQLDTFEVHHNLAHALLLQGRLAPAVASFERALHIKPDSVPAFVNLAGARRLEGRLQEAVRCCQEALKHQADCAEAYSTLGAILQSQGRLDEAIAAMERAVALKPHVAALHSSYLATLHYDPDTTLARLHEAHQEYEARHGARLRGSWPRHDNERHPQRPLRLGFLSPQFRRHPVGYFLIRALEHLDRRQCSVVCYSDTTPADDFTARFQAASSLWREIMGKSDEEVTRQVSEDRIDILFDLAGHTGGNRLLVFARKPAPIQIAWLDYEGTTGLSAMDYLLADRYEVPPEAERWFTEKILRMPDGFVCYEPPAEAPPVNRLPALARGRVTFGCFNLVGKITPTVAATWARILHRLPDARLMIKYHGLDDPPTRSRFEQLFAGHGIAGERLILEGWSPYAEFLTRYHQVDIALDPFPYTGGLTTCEALWMGVPVVTLPGETFASRHGLSHLSNIGLQETIATDIDDYVELAVSLARDLPRLSKVRAGLRQQVASSPLCDGKRFADHLMAILRNVWRRWVDDMQYEPEA